MGGNAVAQSLNPRVLTKIGFPIPIVEGIRKLGAWNYFKCAGGLREDKISSPEKLTPMNKARILRSLAKRNAAIEGLEHNYSFSISMEDDHARYKRMEKVVNSLNEGEPVFILNLFTEVGQSCNLAARACKDALLQEFEAGRVSSKNLEMSSEKTFEVLRHELHLLKIEHLATIGKIRDDEKLLPRGAYQFADDSYCDVYETTKNRTDERVAAAKKMFEVMAALGEIKESEISDKLKEFEEQDRKENYVGKRRNGNRHYVHLASKSDSENESTVDYSSNNESTESQVSTVGTTNADGSRIGEYGDWWTSGYKY